jgi:hypothetical protein
LLLHARDRHRLAVEDAVHARFVQRVFPLGDESSDPAPNLPTVKAMAPNAPSGAAHITMATTLNNMVDATSTRSRSGFARGPIQTKRLTVPLRWHS